MIHRDAHGADWHPPGEEPPCRWQRPGGLVCDGDSLLARSAECTAASAAGSDAENRCMRLV